jgi:YesN/AraC family two-component response regulator
MNLIIVDDEYYNVENVRTKIENNRPVFDRIFCAYSLKQALAVFAEHEISVMICDVEMPGGSGLELLNHIRQHNLNTICIFLTAYAKFEYISQAMKLSSIDYLLKPVEEQHLLAVVDKAVTQFLKQQKALSDTRQLNHLKEKELNLQIQYWNELLRQDKQRQMENAVVSYLSGLSLTQTDSRELLGTFVRSFTELLRDKLKEDREETALGLFDDSIDTESDERICDSCQSAKKWAADTMALYQNCKTAADNAADAVAATKAYINNHLNERLDRDTLAARVYLSPDYLSHCFKLQTGCSLTNYIIEERIGEAKRLLVKKELNIRDIAISCGFQNISYFTRQFKKSTGMTPREFRG